MLLLGLHLQKNPFGELYLDYFKYILGIENISPGFPSINLRFV